MISSKNLENVLKKLKKWERFTGSNHSRCFESVAFRMFGEIGEIVVVEGWLCCMTIMAPKVVGARCLSKFRPIAGLCAMRKVLGYVWLKSHPPLKYESVQTAFVPKTHADAGLFLLLQAAELSREWQKEIVVVQLDVKKAFDHVDHRAAFKAMKLQGVSLFSMALIAATRNGSCMKARLTGSAGVSSHVHNDHGIGVAGPDKELDNTKLAWRLDDFALAAICCADDVVLVAVSMFVAEILVTEVIAKLKEVGLSVGAQKTHWTSYPKTVDKSIEVDGLAVLWCCGRKYWSL